MGKELYENYAAVRVLFDAAEEYRPGTLHQMFEGSEETLPCELLLIAAGFVGCEDYVADAFGVPKTARGCLATAEGGFATASPGVFAAGDCRRGQSLVVHAIAEGRACAKEVDEYLMGYSNMYV